MLLFVIALVIGLILLIVSADRFVIGAVKVAKHFNMPPFLIGMIIIGFGTSAPEIFIAIIAAWQGKPDIALGSAYGSNIANIGLILGLTALIWPLSVASHVLRKELPFLLLSTVVTLLMLANLHLSRVKALLLLALFFIFIGWNIWQVIKAHQHQVLTQASSLAPQSLSVKQGICHVLVGLIVLLLSSRLLVWAAVNIAHHFKVDPVIIALTIVAVGTSLPELASSLVAASRGEAAMVLGNIIGSNIFNTLAVVSIAGFIHPVVVPQSLWERDMSIMLGLSFLLFFLCYLRRKKGQLARLEGAVLLLGYGSYLFWLIYSGVN